MVELRQYAAVSLHLPHSESGDTEHTEACQEASRMINRAMRNSLKPVFLGMDSNVKFVCPSEPVIAEHSPGLNWN